MWAVAEPHPDIVRALLDAGADPHTSTAKGFPPLLFAAGNGDIEMAETLIAAGVDVNETGVDGTHALPYAIVSGHDAFALFLLEQGADPNGSMGGVRALHAAVGRVYTWLGDWNRRHGGSGRYSRFGRTGIDPDRRLPLVQSLLEHGADPNARITTSAMIMSYIGRPKKGAFEPFACGTGDLRGATPHSRCFCSSRAPTRTVRWVACAPCTPPLVASTPGWATGTGRTAGAACTPGSAGWVSTRIAGSRWCRRSSSTARTRMRASRRPP